MDLMNGSHLGNQPAFPSQPFGNKITVEDPSAYGDDDDSDDDGGFSQSFSQKSGKKTKGRVKIRMEFIENKLRRYTTFSKRKTGIMKKAYELSTLTGTQVMLLVASETGHVYTFATRKLQPMITSESGKALIQTCLNSPDPPPMAPGQQQVVEQRMNPTGFEETELTYAVSEEENKGLGLDNSAGLKPVFAVSNTTSEPGLVQASTSQLPQGQTIQLATATAQQQQAVLQSSATSQVQTVSATPAQTSVTKTVASKSPTASMQLPTLPPGFIIQPAGTSITIPVQNSGQTSANSQAQTVYRIPTPQQVITNVQGTGAVLQTTTDTGQQSSTPNSAAPNTVNVLTATPQAAPALTPSVFMYQTPQGIVYAPATASLQDKQIFNFQQPATALSVSQPAETPGGQQIITIPVPVSLAGSPQVLQFTTEGTAVTDLSQPAPKKPRK